MEKTFVQGQINKCCKVLENLEIQPSAKSEMLIKRCKVCGRNHYRLMAEPGIFGLTFKQGHRLED
jgi:hypothetical protein